MDQAWLVDEGLCVYSIHVSVHAMRRGVSPQLSGCSCTHTHAHTHTHALTLRHVLRYSHIGTHTRTEA